MTKSPLAGSKKTDRNPTDRGKQGVKPSLMIDANGLPLSQVVAETNTHDIRLAADTLAVLQTGRSGKSSTCAWIKAMKQNGWRHI